MKNLVNYEHALIVGGSGMLKAASLGIIQNSKHTTMVARDLDRLEQIARESNKSHSVTPLSVDYHKAEKLKEKLEAGTAKNGKFDLAIVWVHAGAPEVPYLIAEFVEGNYFHILSSSFADPAKDRLEIVKTFSRFKNMFYRQVVLGFVLSAGRSRWLSNAEISEGVLSAIKSEKDFYVVGKVRPWSARP